MAFGNDRKIIVTGGAGMIGSALVWALNKRHIDNIVIVDRLGSDEKWKNLQPLQFSDYIDADDFLEIVSERKQNLGAVGHVFHLGACSSTTEQDAGYLMRNNFNYTKTLASWALSNRMRFVYASSAATYGDGSQGMSDRMLSLRKLRPLNMYGYSKHLFDCYTQSRGIAKGLVGIKYFNIFGPNENHKGDMRSVVSKACQQITGSGKVQLFKSYRPEYKDGEQKRDFLYVKDAAEMTLHLADRPLAGGLFNIGSGSASTWLDLCHAIFAALGRQPNIEFIDMPPAIKETYQYFTEADITKLREAGYTDEATPLQESVRDYVVNYLVPGKHLGDADAEAAS